VHAASDVAFEAVLRLVHPNDKLVLVAVAKDSSEMFGTHRPTSFTPSQEKQKEDLRTLLDLYKQKAQQAGVASKICCVVACSNHEGESLCRIARAKAVEYVVLGRKANRSAIGRFFRGSTSQ